MPLRLSRRTVLLSGPAAFAASAKPRRAGTQRGVSGGGPPAARRAYVDSQYGQLHVRLVMPQSDVPYPPLICLHGGSGSGRLYGRLLPAFERIAMAPDLPGCGSSDGPQTRPSIEDYAWTLGQLVDTMGYRQVDLAGFEAGACVATELAVARAPFVRRLVLIAPRVRSAERAQAEAQRLDRLADDGAGRFLGDVWRQTLRPGEPVDVHTERFADVMAAGPRRSWLRRAVLSYDLRTRLSLLRQATLVMALDEPWRDEALLAQQRVEGARLIRVAASGEDAFAAHAGETVRAIRHFLDA